MMVSSLALASGAHPYSQDSRIGGEKITTNLIEVSLVYVGRVYLKKTESCDGLGLSTVDKSA